MKISDYIMLFIAVAFCFASVTFLNINLTTKANIQNTEYANKLTSACYDAAQSMKTGNVEQYGCVWKDMDDLKDTLDVFYTTLAYEFNGETKAKKDEMALYTPVVCLVDINGFYISYNVVFDKTNATKFHVTGATDVEKTDGITPIHTWSKVYGNTVIRFFLNDNVEILDKNGNRHTGNRKEIWKLVSTKPEYAADKSKLSFLNNKDDFNVEKNEIIIQKINDQCEHYINKINVIGDRHDTDYSFHMPQVAGEDWARLLQTPTVISFLQGYSLTADKRYLNVYSLGGGEITKNYHFFVMADSPGAVLQMHCIETELGKDVIYDAVNNLYIYKGVPIDDVYNTQTECLRKYPSAEVHRCVYSMN